MAQADRTRLALDEDVRPLLARLLRDRGWDAVSAVETGRTGLSDEEQLAWAGREGRVLVTHNAADFATLASAFSRRGRPYAGVFIVRQGPVGLLLRELSQALAKRPHAADWTDQVIWAGPAPRRR